MKTFYKLLVLLTALAFMQTAFGQDAPKKEADNAKKEASAKKDGDDKEDAGEVSTELISADKNAVFNDRAKFTFEVKNTTNNEQAGKVSYQVFTEKGVKLNADSVKVKIDKKSTGKYTFEIPEANAGFYKVNFMVNVTDYDDTTRRAFGIRPEEIRSPYKRPDDFDAFWQTAKDELVKVKPNFKVIPMPQLNTEKSRVFLIEMQSLGNITIRAWLTEPKTTDKNKKFAVLVGLPGYQANLDPITSIDGDVAFITLNVRGQGKGEANSRDSINLRRDEFIVYHIEDKNKYIMRGVIMDCQRCIDFIYSRPELKHDKIFVKGGSMGAYLALVTASLDKRVTLCSLQSPVLCDIRNLRGEVEFPIKNIDQYIKTQPGLTWEKVLANLDYFDGKNFAPNVTCGLIMSIGLVDPFAPPPGEFVTYNNLVCKKRIVIFKDLGHDASPLYLKLEQSWFHDEFALF